MHHYCVTKPTLKILASNWPIRIQLQARNQQWGKGGKKVESLLVPQGPKVYIFITIFKTSEKNSDFFFFVYSKELNFTRVRSFLLKVE